MSPTELTLWLGVVITFVSSIFIPEWLRRRAEGTQEERQTNDTWQGMFDRVTVDRDKLQARLDSRDEAYTAQVKRVEEKFLSQITTLRATIAEQQEQITAQGETIERLYAERGRRQL